MMDFTDSQVAVIRDCVVEVMLNRQRRAQPIPNRVRELLHYVSVRGHETSVARTSLKPDLDDIIDTDQVAEILDVSVRHVRRLAADLDGHQVNGVWMFSRQAVTDYANGRSIA